MPQFIQFLQTSNITFISKNQKDPQRYKYTICDKILPFSACTKKYGMCTGTVPICKKYACRVTGQVLRNLHIFPNLDRTLDVSKLEMAMDADSTNKTPDPLSPGTTTLPPPLPNLQHNR